MGVDLGFGKGCDAVIRGCASRFCLLSGIFMAGILEYPRGLLLWRRAVFCVNDWVMRTRGIFFLLASGRMAVLGCLDCCTYVHWSWALYIDLG